MESEQQSQDLTDSKLLNEQQRNILSKFKGPSDVKGAKVQVILRVQRSKVQRSK